jgi:hypothetical protein
MIVVPARKLEFAEFEQGLATNAVCIYQRSILGSVLIQDATK